MARGCAIVSVLLISAYRIDESAHLDVTTGMATVNSGPTSTDGSEQEHLECGGGAKTNAFTRRDTVHQVRTQHASSVIILKISRKPCMLSQENRAISLQISIDTGSADSVVCSVDSFSGS